MTMALHGPLRTASAHLAADVDLIQGATRRLLLALLELDETDLAATASSGLGTKRHVLARLVRQSDRATAALELRAAPIPDDTLLRAPLRAVVDAVTTSLGATLASLTTLAPGAPMHAALGIAADHLAWLELTHVDLADDYDVTHIPNPALDAVAAHLHDQTNSPFAPLVAA
ncbi:hypothetical protein [Agrococcus jejuensis]|uniref:Mycothiol maleylpyruvate isomerase N-terminal domain-containing protein n=1 Tax=Agrococcus jejuensis TaxID=399736 RepID=A0A1G8DNW4_9MICO|nr:hypothetical protein [Agrococcus jejuensis]SDH59315.1 hypothetical protein SAMN04489720_1716 [Agrococcus jejuensis]